MRLGTAGTLGAIIQDITTVPRAGLTRAFAWWRGAIARRFGTCLLQSLFRPNRRLRLVDKFTEPRFIISMAVILLAAVYDLAITFCSIRLDKELATVILTALNANGLVVVISYWLGSSSGSKDKDAQITQLTNHKP